MVCKNRGIYVFLGSSWVPITMTARNSWYDMMGTLWKHLTGSAQEALNPCVAPKMILL